MTSPLPAGKLSANGPQVASTRSQELSLPGPHSIPCRLPPELLTAIFLHYVQQYERFPFYTTGVLPWVNISYVCRYWRSVALNCANLWSHLFFASSEWMDGLLRRSKTVPLIIHIDFFQSSKPGKICSLEKAQALGHMERIRVLWIDCYCSKDALNMIRARLTATAPSLRSLHLSTYDDGETDIIIPKNTVIFVWL